MPRRPATAPRKNASQERSKATVDALLAATARVLVKEGYDRASTNKIADAAGVSIGSLYQYFPTKEALVAAVIRRHMGEMMEVLRTSLVRVAAMPLTEAARELVRVFIEAHRIEPKLHRVLVEQIPRVGSLEEIESIDEEAHALVKAYLEAHRHELHVRDLDMAAFVSVTCVEALTHMAVLRRPQLVSDDSFVEEVATLVVRYLRGGPLPSVIFSERE
ncbi:MAG TPA: TetR/AcrR family transcriptional regulator [Labilithrix sp.]|jgi:AcrR family transcriptional regulator